MPKRTNRKFDESLKRATVAKILAGEKPSDLAKKLQVHDSLIYGWKKKFGSASTPKYAGNVKEAIVYLRHALGAMDDEIAKGLIKKRVRSRALVELALYELQGE